MDHVSLTMNEKKSNKVSYSHEAHNAYTVFYKELFDVHN